MNINNSNLKKVIDHQSDLINRLKQENQNLSFSDNSYYQSVVDSNDYYTVLGIDPVRVIDVYNVPEKGLLGYTQKEFIRNVFEFESDVMFPGEDIKLILNEHYKRMSIAESLSLEHFDIGLKINFICKDSSLIEADYISYYNMIKKECKTFIKFLPHRKSKVIN